MTPRLLRLPVLVVAVFAAGLLASALPASAHTDGDPDGKAQLLGKSLNEFDRAATEPMSSRECEDGMAGPFPCKNVDLESFVPLAKLGGGTGNDIWGWTDPKTGHEYALMGTSNGTAFVDVTKPENPVVVGVLPTQSTQGLPLWRDIKVYKNHAFVVSEYDNHGMQVFDLTRLRGHSGAPNTFSADAVYSKFGNSHNLGINPDSGFAYAVGTNTCEGGLHMVNIQNPENPSFAGCFAKDGYTHDVQCVIYHGPDGRFRGHEICFGANEDTVTIVDVTNKDNPKLLSRTTYPTASYTHQGWLTPDHRYFVFGDELDESSGAVKNTTTYIMPIKKLTDPAAPMPHHQDTPSIDHNLYLEDGDVYESNYTAGLRIFDYTKKSLRQGSLGTEVGFFDVFPASNIDEYAGTWSNYPFFDSGIVVVSSIDSGLFVLRPTLDDGHPRTAAGKKQ